MFIINGWLQKATGVFTEQPLKKVIPNGTIAGMQNTPVELDLAASTQMVQHLLTTLRQQHSDVDCIETHISWVLLAGEHAWKVKKPVNYGFLDYSTQAQRLWGCQEELRLNQRSAAALYVDVVPITGSVAAPQLGGTGPALDYCVHMRRFSQKDLFTSLAAEGQLTAPLIEQLAEQVAHMHAVAEVATPTASQGQPEGMHHAVADNFGVLRGMLAHSPLRTTLRQLLRWTNQEHKRLLPLLNRRLEQGFIRECHGDLHLGNIMLYQGQAMPFDAIEFQPAFRWNDVQADIAFLVMDLLQREQPVLAWRALNRWLEHTGDYEGLALLPYYLAYRALVRAKVTGFRLFGANSEQRAAIEQEMAAYLNLALQCIQPRTRFLWITFGVSGSGKSTATLPLLGEKGIIRLRADVERKRLFGLAPTASSHAAGLDIYTREASARTFAQLRALAKAVLEAGFPVLVDATFIRQSTRQVFADLAAELGVPFKILGFQVDAEVLRERVQRRAQEGKDASEATWSVVQSQLEAVEALNTAEQAVVEWQQR